MTPKISTVIGWPVPLIKGYISMLNSQDSAALVILAYYGVILHKLPHLWWLEGVGSRLVQSITQIVTPEGGRHLLWANAEVSLASLLGASKRAVRCASRHLERWFMDDQSRETPVYSVLWTVHTNSAGASSLFTLV